MAVAIARCRMTARALGGRVCARGFASSSDAFGIPVPHLTSGSKTADGAKQLYNEWARSYDASLRSWGYLVPSRVAELLKARGCSSTSAILDLGCGTGMSGEALCEAGLGTEGGIVGTDISQDSLDLALGKGVYASTVYANLDESLAFDANSFDAACCVGVLSYVERFDVLFPEIVRMLKPGGVFVCSHRSNLWDADERGCKTTAEALEADGRWTLELLGEPEPYMPFNPEESERKKKVRILVFRKAT